MPPSVFAQNGENVSCRAEINPQPRESRSLGEKLVIASQFEWGIISAQEIIDCSCKTFALGNNYLPIHYTHQHSKIFFNLLCAWVTIMFI